MKRARRKWLERRRRARRATRPARLAFLVTRALRAALRATLTEAINQQVALCFINGFVTPMEDLESSFAEAIHLMRDQQETR